MLGGLTAEIEDVIEGGAGLRGSFRHEEVLSGIKLYKGETLRELFDRWKFVMDKFYDEENNQFDLSTIPDVHDSVRFDMLHNPHLGLTEILCKLYDLAKDFADCIVSLMRRKLRGNDLIETNGVVYSLLESGATRIRSDN